MKILLAYVPSATAEAAFDFTLQEAKERGASVLVLASEGGADPKKASAVTDDRPLTQRLEESGIDYELRVVPRRDDPADDILAAAESGEIDMVVLGIRKRTPIGKMLLGSTSQRVIMEAPCPVVCVKPKGFVPPSF
ncbi:universal stress protein [Brachybacterium huguangmaarense]|uniref:Universal stress protein n=1 Tax=Brachybacterium huguangmaarense TaxID=1652028 RepID=A0ABY6G2S3_9MICO|nr:universal stress protein [Brachybacterium huguangmaarense]UYG17510.1 universal stress protein [Brachybacterium huguangmaarense]